MVRSILLSLGVSLALHALLAAAVVVYLQYGPKPDALATLDLSSVDLSFAEQEDSSAPVAPQAPSMPQATSPQPRELAEPPPPEDVTKALPPDPQAPRFADPQETPPPMEAPPRPPAEEVRRDDPPPPVAAAPTPAVAPRQARVDAPPKPRRTIRPVYPKGARQRGEQGEVTVELEVDAEGRVSAVKVVGSSGFAELDDADVRAVRAATFVPAKSGGRAVESSARLTLAFRLK